MKPDIHDAISAWHDASDDDGVQLHEYLGMTWEQYAHWAETGQLPKDSLYSATGPEAGGE